MVLEVKTADNVLAHQVAHVLSIGAEVPNRLKQEAIGLIADPNASSVEECAETINAILQVLIKANIIAEE